MARPTLKLIQGKRLPLTMVAVETGKRSYVRKRLEVPPGRKEKVLEKVNQLETRKGMLTSGATELLRSLRVELGKIEGQEKSAG